MAVLVRMASQVGLPGSETTTIRFAFGLLTILLLSSLGKAEIKVRRFPVLALRGIVGGIGILFYFISLAAAHGNNAVPLTDSVFLGNSYFIYIPIFAALMIHERPCSGIIVMAVVALIGLYLITGAELRHIKTGDIYGFLAGITNAISLIFVRELRKTETTASIFASLCLFGMLVAALMMAFEGFMMPNPVGWWLLAGIGVASVIGQLAMTHSLRYTPTGQAGVINMTTVIYSSAAGIIWFGDPFNLRILLGAILVLGSGTLISLIHGHWIECE